MDHRPAANPVISVAPRPIVHTKNSMMIAGHEEKKTHDAHAGVTPSILDSTVGRQ